MPMEGLALRTSGRAKAGKLEVGRVPGMPGWGLPCLSTHPKVTVGTAQGTGGHTPMGRCLVGATLSS